MSRVLDADVETVLARLHAQSRRELPSLMEYFLLRSIPQQRTAKFGLMRAG